MADQERYWNDADIRYQKGINKRVRGGSGSKKPPGKRRRGWGGGAGPLRNILITSTVAAANVSGTTITPEDFTAWLLEKSGDNLSFANETSIDCFNPFASEVDVTATMARIGTIDSRNYLVSVDCTEIGPLS